ncbi:hypothetical protein [Chroococcidiopsis sp. SAG 2025]|nr:hypothetical protein [Chroococcidiopsis sp. SAG 2025]
MKSGKRSHLTASREQGAGSREQGKRAEEAEEAPGDSTISDLRLTTCDQ